MKSVARRLPLLATAWIAASPLSHAAEEAKFDSFREMLSEDNPGEFWIDAGKELFHAARGPKNASLQACDLGLGPGVVKGAYAKMPRYFKDTGRVESLEGRLVTCMVKLQGFKEADILKLHYLNASEENNTKDELTQLTMYVASESNGLPFQVSLSNAAAKKAYALGEYTFYRRMGTMDLSCASCHGESGKVLRGVALPVMMDPATAGKVMTAFPAYVLKDSKVRTWWWRNARCVLAMRLPWLMTGSDIDVALTLFQIKQAEKSKQPIAVPGLKPRA
jgi:sulfur-oxidizing protein SoxA